MCQVKFLFLTTNYTNFSNLFVDKDLGHKKGAKGEIAFSVQRIAYRKTLSSGFYVVPEKLRQDKSACFGKRRAGLTTAAGFAII